MTENKFGITMKYPSLNPIRDWYLSDNPNTDARITRKPQISNGQICGNATDGFYWCGDNGQIRIHVCPYTGKNDSACECDQAELLQRGYMESPNDWRNFEMSGEWKGRGAGDSLTLYGRGEYHYSSSSSADCDSCKGSSVKVNINLGDQTIPEVRYAFETWHVNYNHTTYTAIPAEVLAAFPNSKLYNQWFRFIYCVYNIENDTKVVCELYLAKGLTNEFYLVKKIVVPDSVEWANGYNGAADCGCPTDTTPILWGGPIASFRWDDMDDADAVMWRKLSIREINVAGGSPTTPPPSTTGTISAKFRDIFNIGVRSTGDSCSGAAVGTAPFTLVYNCTTGTSEKQLSDDPVWDNRTIIAERVKTASSGLFGKKPRRVDMPIKKVGDPSGMCRVKIWDESASATDVVTIGEMDVGDITTVFADYIFYNEDAPQSLPNGMEDEWSIGLEYLGSSATDYLVINYDSANPIDGANTIYLNYDDSGATGTPTWDEKSSRDLKMKVYI